MQKAQPIYHRGQTVKSFGDKLKWLFENIKKPDGSEYSLLDVEKATESFGQRVTTSNLHRLKHDQIRNPGFLTLRAIAMFFQVPLSFFNEDLSTEELERIKIQALPSTIQEIALRTSEMDEADQDVILDMVISLSQRRQQRK